MKSENTLFGAMLSTKNKSLIACFLLIVSMVLVSWKGTTWTQHGVMIAIVVMLLCILGHIQGKKYYSDPINNHTYRVMAMSADTEIVAMIETSSWLQRKNEWEFHHNLYLYKNKGYELEKGKEYRCEIKDGIVSFKNLTKAQAEQKAKTSS